MRLIKLILQDYKAFAGKHEVEIRPLTILIGRNNSGKSALLHAPLLIQQLLDPNDSIGGQQPSLDLFHGKPYIGSLKFGAAFYINDSTSDRLVESFIETYKIETFKMHQFKIIEEISLSPPKRIAQKTGKTISIYNTKPEDIFIFKIKENNKSVNSNININPQQPNQIKPIRNLLQISQSNLKTIIKPEKLRQKKSQPIDKSNLDIKSLDIKNHSHQNHSSFSTLNASTNHDWLLFEQVSDWYKENMGGWRLKKEEFDTYYAIRLVPPRGHNAYRESYTVDFEDAGTGMSAVLPMVVLSHLWRVGGAHISDELPPAIFLAEEPEHHLHPAAHGPLADLFIDLITNDSPHTVMVETHSEVFCLRAQRRVADKTIKPEDVIIHWMDDRSEPGMTRIVPIYIDEHGDTYRVDEQGQRVHFWPPGIFSEDYEEIREIEKLRRESKG